MKTIQFKYIESDDSINLGVPEKVEFEKGNLRDGGCRMKFQTSNLAIGTEEKFSIYLFAEDVNKISAEMWLKYFETEPERAQRDFQNLIKYLSPPIFNHP